ncbi:BTB/POZ fold domain and BTB/Kelch-associated domain-containing protein [Strongyloides ratti]|uniref:BTB/POZ fold domain and BTB/Kelch-associated domain-containing protein n=1 Tax=Strongyloides ratti TaxID=34506 RepID=A0A090LL09_STRRB|nr:BTB/POZ fold domain and BTB/Kelch-associated domain-containing protein [Strongyloides ratti]CEF70514.1 BTB/POZ fold domain and BTB/Kelch-associated domain-containing protein [Strongyloides ratti]
MVLAMTCNEKESIPLELFEMSTTIKKEKVGCPMKHSDGSFIFWNDKNNSIRILSPKIQEEIVKLETLSHEKGKSLPLTYIKKSDKEKTKVYSDMLLIDSHYIKRLIQKKKTKDLVLSLENYECKTIERFVQFLKTGKIKFTLDKCSEFLRLATNLEMPKFTDLIETSIICHADKSLTVLKNCLNQFSDIGNLVSIRSQNVLMTMANFKLTEMVATELILKLSPGALKMYLSNDDLPITSEAIVFKIIIYYLIKGNNQQYVDALLDAVRYNNLNKDDVEEIKETVERYNDSYIKAVMNRYYNDLKSNNEESPVVIYRNSHNLCIRHGNDDDINGVITELETIFISQRKEESKMFNY